MSRVRTRTHGSVGSRRLRPPLTRSFTALADAAIALSALQRSFIFRDDANVHERLEMICDFPMIGSDQNHIEKNVRRQFYEL
jgi:hypothetical protein